MKQLVELQQHSEEFKALNAELIFVFREEKEGTKGLQKIRKVTGTSYTLATDLDKKSSAAYSTKRMRFDNFVISRDGTVDAIIDGTLRDRAKANQLLTTLRKSEGR